jgi:hypothetical protein
VEYLGDGGRALVAEDGQAWDIVVLVRYPNRQAFADMTGAQTTAGYRGTVRETLSVLVTRVKVSQCRSEAA